MIEKKMIFSFSYTSKFLIIIDQILNMFYCCVSCIVFQKNEQAVISLFLSVCFWKHRNPAIYFAPNNLDCVHTMLAHFENGEKCDGSKI